MLFAAAMTPCPTTTGGTTPAKITMGPGSPSSVIASPPMPQFTTWDAESPVARSPVQAGHHVTGVDLSDVHIRRAEQLVPAATFIHGDAATLAFPPASFDAVVCLYALIHMPLAER